MNFIKYSNKFILKILTKKEGSNLLLMRSLLTYRTLSIEIYKKMH